MRFRAAFVSKTSMKTTLSNNRSRKQNSNRLGAYLAAGLAASGAATTTSEAAIITIDLTNVEGHNFTGPNAGLSAGGRTIFQISLANGNTFRPRIANEQGTTNYNAVGFDFNGPGFLDFGAIAYGSFSQPGHYPKAATPTAFSSGTLINGTVFSTTDGSTFGVGSVFREFYDVEYLSPDISNRYLAFQTNITGPNTAPNYGWLRVSWNRASNNFQIYSGAYESVAGVAILAGDTGGGTSAGPEPGQVASSLLLLALGAAGVAIQRQRAKKKQAEAS